MAEGGARRDESGVFPGQGNVSSQQALVQWENASVQICTVMRWLGYGPDIRQARRDAYREIARFITLQNREIAPLMIMGSKAEGLTFYMENDIDKMFLLYNFVCVEDGVDASTFPKVVTVLRSCSLKCYPGHCRLLLERRGTLVLSEVNNAFCDDGYGRELLSSDLYVNNVNNLLMRKNGKDMVQHDRAGPSIPTTVYGTLHSDTVLSLHFYCPEILSKWAARTRHWPPPEVVQKVVSLGAFLTPVGFKGSEYQHVEWRVCFNAGEIELVNNLNETQINLYALLKMVKNDVLNPRKKEVSSYTLKNIVLWISERNPQSLFHERSLLHWLHEGLEALRVALVARELPCYMIPDRNLMAACGLKEEQQRTWISTITEMMNEGPRVVLRLPKIRQSLIAHPEPFRWYSRRRIKLELLNLMYLNIHYLLTYSGEVVRSYVILQEIKRRMDKILGRFA